MKPAMTKGDIANFTPQQISAYYLDLGRLLDRLEKPCTHYQALNIERSANLNQIKQAYTLVLDWLYAPYSINATIPAELQSRAEAAFQRVSLAFGVLANFARRMEYDRQLTPTAAKPAAAKPGPAKPTATTPVASSPIAANPVASKPAQSGPVAASPVAADHAASKPAPARPVASTPVAANPAASNPAPARPVVVNTKARASALKLAEQSRTPIQQHNGALPLPRISSQLKAYSMVPTNTGDLSRDRRRVSRIKLAVPARVTGHERIGGKWNEMATTVDVSRTGVTIQMRHRVRPGLLLYLTLPMPTKLRNHGHSDAGYAVYCLVRRVDPQKRGVRNVGLEFIGANPPPGFLDKPWATFKPSSWAGDNRRRKPRKPESEIVVVEYYDEAMRALGREMARTENLSSGGMQVCVRTAPAEFELLRILCPNRGFESFGALRNRFRGQDGFERLCIQFSDGEWNG